MPLQSHIDPARRLVTTELRDRVTSDDVRHHQRSLKADPDFDPDFDHLFDLTEVDADSLHLSTPQIRTLASVSLFSPASRRAVVAPQDVLFGLARMYEGFRDLSEENFQVFRSREEARAWLEVDEEDALR